MRLSSKRVLHDPLFEAVKKKNRLARLAETQYRVRHKLPGKREVRALLKFFDKTGPAIFNAEALTPQGLTIEPFPRATVHVYPFKDGSGYLYLIWRGDLHLSEELIENCVVAGGTMMLNKPLAAAMRAVDRLLYHYPVFVPGSGVKTK